ncbi:MAG: hypothetical protein WBB01_17055, partial [Phormidesmis sp.]
PRAFALPTDPPSPPLPSPDANKPGDKSAADGSAANQSSSNHANGQSAGTPAKKPDGAEAWLPPPMAVDPPIAPPTADPPSESAELPADRWEVNQDQDNIKRFAQFFNGQIVDLDDDLEGPPDQSTRHKSSDPGPDVPF